MHARIALLLTTGLAVAGCEGITHSCTLIGCLDGLGIEVRSGQGGLADGRYALDLTAQQAHACTFTVPDDLPARGSAHQVECTPELDVLLQGASVCMEQRRGNAVSESCTPVAGQFVLQARVQGTPRSVELRVDRDGTTLFAQTLTPAYETTHPNGPDCEPECRVASLEVTLP
jgi:hypothetical protein